MADDLTVGAVIAGRYRLERLLAEGGMGVVWAAKHLVTRKPVALKFVKGEAANDERTRRRLLREARAACAVQHPNVVAVHDVMELESGSPVLVMDLLKGESLRAKLDREGRIPLHDLANILIPVISAVGTAHSAGVVHRDLKPENIFLALMPGGAIQVKVLDFGIAKLTSTEGLMAHSGALTGTGLLLGTPDYMSVEQILGEEDVDHRADVWALGIVLYECLNGHRPTAAENVGKVLKIILTNAILPIQQVMPGLPEDIKSLITRMLTLDRSGRPTNLVEVGRTLERYGTVPLLPFELPRARALSEFPPPPPIALPSSKVQAPRPPRLPGDSAARTLGPGYQASSSDAEPPASRQARTTAPDRRGASGALGYADTTIARPPPGSRQLINASRPILVPPALLARDSMESGIPIALDEPFSMEAVSSDRQLTMSKSLTLGDLLSPDELAMLGERLERAQSHAPGARESMPPDSSLEAPISSSEFMPASIMPPSSGEGALPGPISSDEPVTLVGARPLSERDQGFPFDLGRPESPTEPDLTGGAETMPVSLNAESNPTLPFSAPQGLRSPSSPDAPQPFPAPSTPRPGPAGVPLVPSPVRLSFGDPGGSMDYAPPRLSFGDPGGSRAFPVPPPPTARSTEVQTPHSTTAPAPASSSMPMSSSRRGLRVVALIGLGFGASVALWLLMKPPPPPTDGVRPVDSASAAPLVAVSAAPLLPGACPPGMAVIPGETFAMGIAEGRPDERPVHEVAVQSFCMDMTEVTGVAYQRCVDENRCEPLAKVVTTATTYKQPMTNFDRAFESGFCQDPKRDGAKYLPINCVNWNEANTFCRVQGKRLPTEEEWEYTARGGAELRLFPWGTAAPSPKLLNACGSECGDLYERLVKKKKNMLFAESDGQPTLSPVGSFPAGDTRYGTHDMSGNVWEWTASAHCTYPSHSCSNPNRVFRGGSFVSSSAPSFWGTTRMSGAPENRYMDVGFRCAKDKI